MKSYSEDLRRKIVAAVEKRGMSKTQAAHLFDVSLSSVKRFSRMAREGNSLAPKKRPGRTPKVDEKAKKLLNEHMKERPAATIAERISFLQSITGERLSYSTIRRLCQAPGMEQKKRSVGAAQRDEFLRAAWRVTLAQHRIDPEQLVFVDEMGTHTSLFPISMSIHRRGRGRTARFRATEARTRRCSHA
jgi:transposase